MMGGPTALFQNLLLGTLIGAGGMGITAAAKGLQNQRREEGKSGLLGGRPGDMTPEQMRKEIDYYRKVGGLGIEQLRQLSPLMEQMKGADFQRYQQANQQLGQIQAGLAGQKYRAQLAGGAQQQSTNMLNSLLQNQNPYGIQAFNAQTNLNL